MKLSTLNSKLNLLAVGTNAKTVKGDDEKSLTAIMYLAPNTISGFNTCSHASTGCIESCLFTAGRGAMNNVMQARIRKTKLFFAEQEEFLKLLNDDLNLFTTYCKDNEAQGFVRLNGTSDIEWEKFINFSTHASLKFYDYTKNPNRAISNIENYYLTFSRHENHTDTDIQNAINSNFNVAVVFDEVPAIWKTYNVVEGDLSDMRWEDPRGVIVGLKAKGKAKKDTSNFVVRLQ